MFSGKLCKISLLKAQEQGNNKKNELFTVLKKFDSQLLRQSHNHRDQDSTEMIRVKIVSSVSAFLSIFISSWFDLIISVFSLSSN